MGKRTCALGQVTESTRDFAGMTDTFTALADTPGHDSSRTSVNWWARAAPVTAAAPAAQGGERRGACI